MKTKLEIRTYYDMVDEITISFLTDATQKQVDSHKFEVQWHVAKYGLQNRGFVVIELNESN